MRVSAAFKTKLGFNFTTHLKRSLAVLEVTKEIGLNECIEYIQAIVNAHRQMRFETFRGHQLTRPLHET